MTNVQNFVIIRHGETKWNTERKLQGQANSDLTRLGLKQTELVSNALKDEKFDFFFSSDLKRCQITSEIINKHHSKEIIYDQRLRERDFGILQGMTKEMIKNEQKEVYGIYKTGSINFAVPEGEGVEEFFNRTMDFFDDVLKNFSEKKSLIVTHGGILDCLIRKTTGMSLDAPRCFSIYNTSVNRFSVRNGKWKLVSWGDLSHLNSELTIDDF